MTSLLQGPVHDDAPTFATVNDAIEAARSWNDHGFTFVADGGAEHLVTYGELMERAGQVAAQLLRRGVLPGDHLVLILPDNEAFIAAFLGAIWVGVVPVPIYPPLGMGRLKGYIEQAAHIVEASQAIGIVTDRQIHKVLGTLLVRCRGLRDVMVLDELQVPCDAAPLADVAPDATCFLQFTSGSTSHPKGVTVTHGNLAANTLSIGGHGLGVTSEDCGVSWLPLYHDMGLIGCVLTPLFYQVPMVSMAPLAFLKRPRLWLEAISRHGGTMSFAPNFAYGLCTRRIRDRYLEGLDLSTWRVAGCGAEPIRRETLDQFADRFASVGFRPDAIFPTYGLAEATLAVSFSGLGRGLRTDAVSAQGLIHDHRAVPAGQDGSTDDAQHVVCCGTPFPGHDIAVVDGPGEICAEREVGQILARGPSIMPGYHGDEAASRRALQGGWLHTGDLGYVAEGELYVCGRMKELIIVAGKNYYPHDIEQVVWGVPEVRTGNVIAFGVPGEDGEELVVALETRATNGNRSAVACAVRSRVSEATGLVARDIVVLGPGSLPKTSSGKLQRRKTAQLYSDDALVDAAHQAGALGVIREVASSQLGYVRSYLGRRLLRR